MLENMIDELKEEFRKFRNKNESFVWEANVTDKEGYEATILVDFIIANYEKDKYGMAWVSAYGENNPTNDEEEIRNSEAFEDASEIIEEASREIIEDSYPDCESIVTHEGGELVVENIYTIFWGE